MYFARGEMAKKIAISNIAKPIRILRANFPGLSRMMRSLNFIL
jgi:hypothetical protein